MGLAYEWCKFGCDSDPALAMHYCPLAALRGEAEVAMALSKWFVCGHDNIFKKNDELAFAFARRAVEAQLALAEFAVGHFYETGMHIPVDLYQTIAWYERASEHGNSEALGRLDYIKKTAGKGQSWHYTKPSTTSGSSRNISLSGYPTTSPPGKPLTSGIKPTYGFKVRATYDFVPTETG